MDGVRKTIELAYHNGAICHNVPPTQNSRNAHSWFRKKHGKDKSHTRMTGKYLVVFFDRQIEEKQKEIDKTMKGGSQ